jgi:polyisoprenoid-binding protein YceI
MMKYGLWMIVITVSLGVQSQVLQPVDKQSSVKFRIRQLGFPTTGSFTGLQGTIKFSPETLANSSMDVTIQSNTVNTGNDMRDNHLRKPEYFNVKKYPLIRFVSDRITTSTKAGTLFITGMLTIKNVTRKISFPFTAVPQNDGYLFTGEFKINRLDFDVGESSTVADNLTVSLRVFARK